VTLPAGPGQLYLVDTSAQARIRHPAVRAVIAGLIVDRAAATCVTVDLEAGYSGRDLADLRAIAERRKSLYVVLPITEAIAERARDVQIRMAARGHHRARLDPRSRRQRHGAPSNYDADFEHIAASPASPIPGSRHAAVSPDIRTPANSDPGGRTLGFQVRQRTFFRYFTGKEELIIEDALSWLPVLLDKLRHRPDDEDVGTALRRAIQDVGTLLSALTVA
jgi:predicted nucleic acid-binding protein